MKIKLYFFGKKTEISEFETEMSQRINHRCDFEIIPLAPAGIKNIKELKKQEAEKIFAKITDKDFIIAFDQIGEKMTSEKFSQYLNKQLEISKNIVFIIGGAYGLDKIVLEKANKVISFGDMTWTKNLFRKMACEQIYRAFEIKNNSNFHK